MRKTILVLSAAMLVGGTIFTGCNESAAQKLETAEERVLDAKEDLKEARKEVKEEAKRTATADEWKAFRDESHEKIKENEKQIAVLKVKINRPGKLLDAARSKKVDSLEEKNADLRKRLDAYEKGRSDWEGFKREFNHDLDKLEKALKDLGVDNTN